MPSAIRSSLALAVTALPWCCIGPAVFSLSGAAIAGVGALLRTATPIFLLLSLGFLARARYLSVIQRHGPRCVRIVTVTSAFGVSLLWGFRLGVWAI